MQLSGLKENWGLAGAQSIEVDSLVKAFELLYDICEQYPKLPEPHISPLGSGGVQLEWHTAESDLEIEVSPGGRLTVYFDTIAGASKSWTSDPTFERTDALKGLQELIALASP